MEAYAKHQSLWFDPEAVPHYSDVLDVDLSKIGMSLAGPKRPQDRIAPQDTAVAIKSMMPQHARSKTNNIPDGAVALAAITSCTNTSDPRLLVAAGLVARKANALGIRPPDWVKTSLAPGSPAAEHYLTRSGLLEDLSAIGFDIVGYGCTTCIGNSGPLAPVMADAVKADAVFPVAVLSGNRNFPGRVHPDIDAAFLASPPLVIVYALAGDAMRDVTKDPITITADGRMIYLHDLWPSADEVDAALRLSQSPGDYACAFNAASANETWKDLEAPNGAQFPWEPTSTYLRRPPFASLKSHSRLGSFVAHPLLVLGDDITTDHISPAGQIPLKGEAGHWLMSRGDDAADLNVFASRRGNFEVMLRGAYTNKAAQNFLSPDIPAGMAVHVPSGDVLPLWQVAQRYAQEKESVVLVAGERYGTGSSRDWAAKAPALLGVRAVIASSFERIHRSNLIGMGILPIRLPQDVSLSTSGLALGDRLEIHVPADSLSPRMPIEIVLHKDSGQLQRMPATVAVETSIETDVLRVGGLIPYILRRAAGVAD